MKKTKNINSQKNKSTFVVLIVSEFPRIYSVSVISTTPFKSLMHTEFGVLLSQLMLFESTR